MINKETNANRLAGEKSPYLLQHADNPVKWYPWGQEAFAEAARRDVPVFLSIGYSTCHWCHVMAHESFEDEEVAALLNEGFVSIKVDREERLDIDSVYMSVCQAMTGSGGWPLTIIMTPDKKPFFAGTYFPKHRRYGAPGLLELLSAVTEKWQLDRSALIEQSQKIPDFLQEQNQRKADTAVSAENLIAEAAGYFSKAFDQKWGGFGPAPKFPSAHNLLFLLAQKDKGLSAMVNKTLTQMYRGGIFDQIGGGFCRYSTDKMWLVPHFEKMLYDNALLLLAYAQAAKESGKSLYLLVADRIVRYVLRELTHEEGSFYCSQDADSDGEEGKYYVFTPAEIKEVLGREAGLAFCRRFDITKEGNFEGKNIPNLIERPDYEEFPAEYMLLKLYRYRQHRCNLHKDDKILTSWNGLMIAALARSARLLDRPDYLEAALQAEDFIWHHLHQGDGRLLARYRDGESAFAGTLEDYAFFSWALLECYSSTFDEEYLKRAVSVANQLLELFFDGADGGCFLYAKDSEQLIVRPKETYDGAMPSGNSVAALVMRKLAFFTGEERWRSAYDKQSAFLQKSAQGHPAGQSFFLWQLTEEMIDSGQLICVSRSENLPPRHLLWAEEMNILVKTDRNADALQEIAPFLREYPIPETGADYYYCQGHVCHQRVRIDT